MPRKNRDYVAATPGSIDWYVDIHPTAATSGEITTELWAIIADLFESFGDFITPTAVELEAGTVPTAGTPLDAATDFEPDRTTSLTRDDGVTVPDLHRELEALDPPADRTAHLRTLGIAGTRVRLRLEHGDVEVDRNTNEHYKFGDGARSSMETRRQIRLAFDSSTNGWGLAQSPRNQRLSFGCPSGHGPTSGWVSPTSRRPTALVWVTCSRRL